MMKPDAKTARKGKRVRMSTKKGITLISILAILILVVNIFTASFSWFLPTEKKGTGMSYDTTVDFRSENCIVDFHYATKINGVMNYTRMNNSTTGNVDVDGDNVNDVSIAANMVCTIYAGKKGYFKAEITNESTQYPTIVSLFMSTFPNAAIASGKKVSIGISYPSNSYRTFTEQQTDMHLIRNAYLNKNDGNNEDASLSVEWFVEAPSDADVSIDLNQVYLMYN